MSFLQGVILVAAAITVAVISIKRSRSGAMSWKAPLKAGGYLAGTAFLLIASKQEILGGWGTFLCLIIAVLSLWSVIKPPTHKLLAYLAGWRGGSGGQKVGYFGAKLLDKGNQFLWGGTKLPRLRLARRVAVGVIAFACLLSWGIWGFQKVFGGGDSEMANVEVSNTPTSSPETSTTSEVPTSTSSTASSPDASTVSASVEALYGVCKGATPAPLVEPKSVPFNTGDLWVCRSENWLEWKTTPVPDRVSMLAWAEGTEEGKVYDFAVIQTDDGKQFYVKSLRSTG